MKIVMIIPAKGDSSRLPGKNLRPFAGPHPLVAWSIVQARYSKRVDEVWVSTNSDEVREVAESYGANVMMRDYVDTVETPGSVPVREWINRMLESGSLTREDRVIPRLCTTPTLLPGDIDNAIAKWEELHRLYGCEGITMAAELRTFHCQRKVVPNISRVIGIDVISENNYAIVQNLAFFSLNRIADLLGETPKDLYQGDHPIGYYYNLRPWQMTDVDTEEEFQVAELLAEHYILKGRDMIETYKSF